jgi:hypothetical protein
MRFLLFIPIILLLSCGGIEKREAVKASHDMDMNLPAIDDMIVTLKKEYIERCYMPVIKKVASNSPRPCETSLQQLLERRFYSNYTQDQVDMAADELFFKDVRERLAKKIKTEPSLRKAVGRKFGSMDEIMSYYKAKYTFRKLEVHDD